ncbi:3-hydroxyacyl-CoA dehydrogenase family protein [Gorillibacterium massiliense]|uniref:3-hydroxyacyl-CoA dehydrogenase family protein n=1 Tax=Gorillibacterium massiliense TaxID=1280390 RepID=UPI0004BB4437|nr:3-hydroxyacyl-CoA dehydrogenase NAD-binding domain-containing protein [Gorillibacterium massiliense]
MKFTKIGLVGVGTIGQGIAEMLAKNGMDVVLVDKSPDRLCASMAAIESSLDRQIEKWGITSAEKKLIVSRLRKAESPQDLASCQLIIESATEDLDIKKDIFRKLDEVAPEALLASTTSTLSLTELAGASHNPERVIGLHFLYAMSGEDIVEVIRGIRTSDETFQNIRSFVEDTLHIKGVQVHESPGFVTTRLACTLINEAIAVLAEGVATAEDIDIAMREGYDFRYGPLEMCDRFGLDSVYFALNRMFIEYGELKYRPNFLLKKMVRAGQLGVKTGEGFFSYDKDGVRL